MKKSLHVVIGIAVILVLMFVASYLLENGTIGVPVFAAAAVLLIIGLFLVILPFGKVTVTLTEDSLRIDAPYASKTIPLSSIISAEFRENVKVGARVAGYGGAKRHYGTFSNREFGLCNVAVDANASGYIVMRYDSDKVFVIGFDDASEAREIVSKITGN